VPGEEPRRPDAPVVRPADDCSVAVSRQRDGDAVLPSADNATEEP
jgi:hypothetical protein